MTNPLIEEKEIQLARAMSDKAIARIKIAAAILGITPKHLHELAKRPDFPAKSGSDLTLLDGGFRT